MSAFLHSSALSISLSGDSSSDLLKSVTSHLSHSFLIVSFQSGYSALLDKPEPTHTMQLPSLIIGINFKTTLFNSISSTTCHLEIITFPFLYCVTYTFSLYA